MQKLRAWWRELSEDDKNVVIGVVLLVTCVLVAVALSQALFLLNDRGGF